MREQDERSASADPAQQTRVPPTGSTAEATPPPAEVTAPKTVGEFASTFAPDTPATAFPTPLNLESPPSSSRSSGSVVVMPEGPLEPGVMLGRYRLEEMVGEGGMGSVWRVTHTELNAQRALKLIAPKIASDPNVRARFKREAEVMAQLSHPNAVTVHNAQLTEGAAYIEMEFVKGRSFAQILKGKEPMPLAWVGRVLEQICDVLQAAHDLKIVHRDLKPSNLMLVDGRAPGRELVKVLDFGIAKILQGDGGIASQREQEGDLTQPGSFLGTTPYASPEQIRGESVNHRSDLYSLGVLLYEMLTGSRPFTGSNNLVMAMHLTTPAPRFQEKVAGCHVPESVENVVLRLLEKDPARRHSSATALLEAFQEAMMDAATTDADLEESKGDFQQKRFLGAETTIANPAKVLDQTGDWPGASGCENPVVRADQLAAMDRYEVDEQEDATAGTDRRWRLLRSLGYWVVGISVLVFGYGFFAARSRKTAEPLPVDRADSPLGKTADRDANRPLAIDAATQKRIAASMGQWNRKGFTPIGATSAGGWPETLVNNAVKPPVEFHRHKSKSGVYYLPKQYEANGDEERDGWPAEIKRTDGVIFRRIPAGSMHLLKPNEMGTPVNQDFVIRLSGFYIQQVEVTNGEFKMFREKNPDTSPAWQVFFKSLTEALQGNEKEAALHPARGVTWRDADAFARSWSGALPTEMQWEYAARSGDNARSYVWSDNPIFKNGAITPRAHVSITDPETPVPTVIGKENFPDDQTDWLVFDLTGNVREWCRDRFEHDAPRHGESDPKFPADSGRMVVRGGSFATTRTAGKTYRTEKPIRQDETDANELKDVGFRIVLECPEPVPSVNP